MKYQLRDYQQEWVRQVFAHWANGKKRVLGQLPTGGGKCLVKDTPVLMYDGTIKAVQDVVPGDILMGDDSTARTVQSICTGEEMCYDITPVKGKPWGCNESHILSLVCNANSGRFTRGEVYDVSVREYFCLSKTDRHVLKQYRVGVEFPDLKKSLKINPYFLGLWLGDGNSNMIAITNPDKEIISFLKVSGYGVRNMEKRVGKCQTWLFPARENQRLYSSFKELSLFKNKHIPHQYLTSSRTERLDLLAGILDTDGHLTNGGFEIAAKSNQLAADIIFLAKSLGLAAYSSTKMVKLKGWEEARPYNRIFISGNTSEIPCRVERKRAAPRLQVKDHLRTGFKITPRGVEQYYGFEIDGNRRFLLGDFTVTHNTVIFNHITALAAAKGKRVLIIADRQELIFQSWTKLWDGHGIHAGIIMAGQAPAYQLPVQIASIQTLNRRSFPPDIDLIIIDECRGSVSPQYAAVFAQYPNAHYLGVDATPIRTSGQGFDHLYDEIVVGPGIKHMEQIGALVPANFKVNAFNPGVLDRVGKIGGDYNERELSKAVNNEGMIGDLVASKLKWAPGLKTMVFAVDIAHSLSIVERYRKAGIEARHVDGDMKEERVKTFSDFKAGKFEVLSNVGIATYGYDEPSVMAIQLARPTMSLALYLQMVGRGARPYQGKSYYTLLDHGNCIYEHGLPNAERKWTLKGKVQVKKNKVYSAVINGQKKIFTGRDMPLELDNSTLEEVDERTIEFVGNMRKFDKIRERQIRRGYKPLWSYFQYAQKYPEALGLEELKGIGSKLNFNPGWAYRKFEELSRKDLLCEKNEK